MANDLVPYSQALSDPATTASSLESTDVIAIAREDSARPTGFKSMVTRLLTLAKKIVSGIDYSTELTETDAKTITGAINEVAQNSGSVDITTAIDTPASVQTFSDGGDNIPLKSLVAEIVPIQSGSGVPSPQNVRAISGHSSVNVVRCGINIWSEEWVRGYYSATTGALVEATATTLASSKHLKVYPNLKIKCICPSTLTFGIFRYKLDGTYIDRITGVTSGTVITIPDDVYEIAFQIPNYGATTSYTYQNDVSLNIPDSDSQYHSYSGEQVTIPLGQTVYGGSLECVEGKGQVTLKGVDMGDLTYTYDSANTRMVVSIPDFISSGTRLTPFVCSCFQTIDDGRPLVNVPDNSVYSGNVGNAQVYFQTSTYTDPSAFKTAMTGQTLVYPITPTSLSVSGANIPTLSGLNNIYTDCGDIQSLEYFNDKADDIAAMISLMTRS